MLRNLLSKLDDIRRMQDVLDGPYVSPMLWCRFFFSSGPIYSVCDELLLFHNCYSVQDSTNSPVAFFDTAPDGRSCIAWYGDMETTIPAFKEWGDIAAGAFRAQGIEIAELGYHWTIRRLAEELPSSRVLLQRRMPTVQYTPELTMVEMMPLCDVAAAFVVKLIDSVEGKKELVDVTACTITLKGTPHPLDDADHAIFLYVLLEADGRILNSAEIIDRVKSLINERKIPGHFITLDERRRGSSKSLDRFVNGMLKAHPFLESALNRFGKECKGKKGYSLKRDDIL